MVGVTPEEVEDTPIFQERVSYLEGQAKMIKAEVKLLITQAHAFAKAGVEYSEAGKVFAAKAQELGKVMPALQSVADGLKGVYALFETMGKLQDDALSLEQLYTEIKQAKQMRADMDKAGEDFYASLNKSLALRSDAEPALQLEIDRENMRHRGRFDLLRLEYLGRLSDISSRKHQQFIAFFRNVIQKLVAILQGGLEALQDASPVVADSKVDDVQKERQQMRLQLITSHIEEHEALLPTHVPSNRSAGGLDLFRTHSQHLNKLQYVCEFRGWLGKCGSRHRAAPRGGRHDSRQSRYWSVLSGGKLFLYKNWRDAPKHVFDLLLCTVREARNVPERFCFEIISPTNSVLLQAETHSAMAAWTQVIQNATGKALDAQVPRGSGMTDHSQALRSVAGNNVCADCAASNPEWASVSLGVLVCLQCSGHHRSLGVHISRVRSLQLDVWEDSTIQLMSALGNAKVNSIFLARPHDTGASAHQPLNATCHQTLNNHEAPLAPPAPQPQLSLSAGVAAGASAELVASNITAVPASYMTGVAGLGYSGAGCSSVVRSSVDSLKFPSSAASDAAPSTIITSGASGIVTSGASGSLGGGGGGAAIFAGGGVFGGSRQYVLPGSLQSKQRLACDDEHGAAEQKDKSTDKLIGRKHQEQQEKEAFARKHQEQELLIRRKYQERVFVAGSGLSVAELSTALHAAIKNKDILSMLQAIANKVDVNKEEEHEPFCTPLMQAVKADSVAAIELLLQNRADIEKRDDKGRTCLHHAASLDHGSCTDVLLVHGASADARDDLGETALEVAAHAPRAQAFEAIVRFKGLRMGGKTTGFPGSGSDPEDSAASPRSASPPMAKAAGSPDIAFKEASKEEASVPNLRPQALSFDRPGSEHRHRRGLSWSMSTRSELTWTGWNVARKNTASADTSAALATGAPQSDWFTSARSSATELGEAELDAEGAGGRESDAAVLTSGGGSNKKSSRMVGLLPQTPAKSLLVSANASSRRAQNTLMRGLEHLKGLQHSKPTRPPSAPGSSREGAGGRVD